MRFLKRLIFLLTALVVMAIALLYITGNEHIIYGVRSTYFIGKGKPDIDDMRFFDVSVIQADLHEPWAKAADYNNSPLTPDEKALHDQYQSTAFLVFRNDSLVFEEYFGDGGPDVKSNSFSMAKTFVGLMIGKAIEEGYIKSVDQKAGDFLPEFRDGKAQNLTIKHLLQMSSGIPFGESYGNPFGYVAKSYFGKDLVHETLKFTVENEPGSGWTYEGGNTVLLGMILGKATGRSCSDYFHQKLWSCIGAKDTAYWNLDHAGGMEKVFSGVYATASDFARIGRLFNHYGVLGTDTVISPDYIKEAFAPCMHPDISPKSTGEKCYWYGYQLWMGKYNGDDFYSCRGLRGQYIIAIPSQQMIVVRLGHLQSDERVEHMPVDMKEWLKMAERLSL